MRYLTISLICVAALTAGCSTDDPVQPQQSTDDDPTWQLLDLNHSDPYLLNLSPQVDRMIVVGRRFYRSLDAAGETVGDWVSQTVTTGWAVPTVAGDYFAYPMTVGGHYAHNLIHVNYAPDPTAQIPLLLQLPLVVLDSSLPEDARYEAWGTHSPIVGLRDDGLMLVPVFDSTNGSYIYAVRLTLTGTGLIEHEVERRIRWPHEPFWILTIGERFFAATVRATYEILSDGRIVKVSDEGAYSMIEYDGHLYMSNWNGIFESKDGGVSWERVAYSDRGILFVVDDQLCLQRGRSSYRVDLGAGMFSSMIALRDDGLPGTVSKSWQPIAQFGDRVYLATPEGLYYTSVTEFFRPSTTP